MIMGAGISPLTIRQIRDMSHIIYVCMCMMFICNACARLRASQNRRSPRHRTTHRPFITDEMDFPTFT